MLISLVLYLYIFFLSFTGAFVAHRWFPIHVILLLTATVLSLPKLLTRRKFPWNIYHTEDVFLYVGLIAVLASSLLHMNDKTINYLLAYFYIFGIGYFILKQLLYENGSISRYFDINTVAVLTVSIYALFEVAAKYFAHLDIQSFIPRIRDATATYNTSIPRAYAFCTEPTILSYYLNTLGPIALWRLWQYRSVPKVLKYLLTLLLVLAWILTFSPPGIVFMIVSVFVVLAIRFCDTRVARAKAAGVGVNRTENSRRRNLAPALSLHRSTLPNKKVTWTMPVILAVIAIATILCIMYSDSVRDSTDPLLRKIFLTGESAEDRVSRWNYAIDNIFADPLFGKGIGYLSSKGSGSSISWYLFLTLEAGFIASAFFIMFLLFSFCRIWRSQNALKYWFLVGFLSAVLHLNVISTIHHPFLWVLIALFDLVHAKEKAGVCL